MVFLYYVMRGQRSFMCVVMFSTVFGLIVWTEIFPFDLRRWNVGNTGSFGGHRNDHSLTAPRNRSDYEEVGAEDNAGLKGDFHVQAGLLIESAKAAKLSNPRGLAVLPSSPEGTDAEWLPVMNTKFKFFVYSAYYDDRFGGTSGAVNYKLIRVIGATKTRAPERVWCRLWYRQLNSGNVTASVTVPAKVKAIRENKGLEYSACFVICPLPKESPSIDKVPVSVSIVAGPRVSPTNRILVQNRPEDRPKDKKPLGVCVKPLYLNYNRVLQLVEFIELYRILGASDVNLYDNTVSSEAACTLRYYEKRGIVSVLSWHNFNFVSRREIHTEGLLASFNDCLYRSMYKYEYVAFVDLDEFVIPRHNDTILNLMKWLDRRFNTRKTGSFTFRNAFFYLRWPDDTLVRNSKTAVEASLIMLRKTRRKLELYRHRVRSKYVTKPQYVVEAGNHFVWEFIPGRGTFGVSSNDAILHHYRVLECDHDDLVKTPSIVDRTAYKYRNELVDIVNVTWSELGKECVLPKLEPIPQEDKKTN